MKKYDVVALGELLVDFTENGTSAQGNPILEANPGGAPCNVLAMLNKLGRKTAFIGKVGDDPLGHMLKTVAVQCGIDVTNLLMDSEIHTTLTFVHTFPDGEREFSFYRNPGADMLLRQDEVQEGIIKAAKIFHFGTLSMTHEGVREATHHAVDIAKENGLLVSFDPNLREPLWNSLENAKKAIAYGLSKCDILKISDNELEFMTGTTDYTKGVRLLRESYDLPLVFVTLGKEGSRAYYHDIMVEAKPFMNVHTIEKTGAGDTFTGCVLHFILDYGLEHLTEEVLWRALLFANAGAALITTKKGALKVMPEQAEIEALICSEQ